MKSKSLSWLVGLGLVCAIAGSAVGGDIRVTTTGSGNGSSWAAASSLANALKIAQPDDALWIAEGTYTNNFDGTTSFRISTNNLTLYGGFTNGMAGLGERNRTAYPTILSGNNVRRVVTVTAANATLDGLTVRDGYLIGTTTFAAGVYKDTSGSLLLANCDRGSESQKTQGG
jgi:hypothetical protein